MSSMKASSRSPVISTTRHLNQVVVPVAAGCGPCVTILWPSHEGARYHLGRGVASAFSLALVLANATADGIAQKATRASN
jgi:hypothetical protein